MSHTRPCFLRTSPTLGADVPHPIMPHQPVLTHPTMPHLYAATCSHVGPFSPMSTAFLSSHRRHSRRRDRSPWSVERAKPRFRAVSRGARGARCTTAHSPSTALDSFIAASCASSIAIMSPLAWLEPCTDLGARTRTCQTRVEHVRSSAASRPRFPPLTYPILLGPTVQPCATATTIAATQHAILTTRACLAELVAALGAVYDAMASSASAPSASSSDVRHAISNNHSASTSETSDDCDPPVPSGDRLSTS